MNQIHKTNATTIALICLLSLVQTSLVWAANDITGDWEITMDLSGRQSFATLSISKNADGTLTGKWGSSELSDVKFQNGKLTFVRTSRYGDREYKSNYAGILKDGKLTGTMSSDRGKYAANGARKQSRLPVLGSWDMKFNVGDREITGKLAISQKPDGTLDGKWTSERGQTLISNVKFQDGKLTYDRKSTFGDRKYESTFEGTVKGHELTGAFKSQQGQMPATGQRAGAALIGKWELTTTSERGTRTRLLTVFGDLTGRYESFGSEIPIKELKLEGDQVTFNIETGSGDRAYMMNFKGKLDGKTLNGERTTSRGTSKVTGKKIEAASTLVGKWEITRESSRGTRTNTLKINADMTGTYTSRDNELAVKELKVDGNQVSFKVITRYGDRDVPAEFKGRLDGTTLVGERTTSRGTSKFTGKKVD